MPSLRAWLIHEVTRARYSATAVGAKGDPVFAPQERLKARVEKTSRLVRTPNGREVVASHVMALEAPVDVTDRFWLPSIAGEPADDPTDPQRARTPLSVEVAVDKRGRCSLCRVYFA